MFFVPYRIESLPFVRPWANWLIMGASTWISMAAFRGEIPESTIEQMVADGLQPAGLFGYVFLHGDYVHLAGNMLFLWIFGNAVCGMIGNAAYLIVYPACGALAAIVHHHMGGGPMIGASGAINGMVGMVLAICPLNRVTLCFCLLMPTVTFTLPAWQIILVWLAFDLRGAIFGAESLIAYWAHIGGFGTGLAGGMIMLKAGAIALTEWDSATLLDLLRGRRPHVGPVLPPPVSAESIWSLPEQSATPPSRPAVEPVATPGSATPQSDTGAEPSVPAGRRKLSLRRRSDDTAPASAEG